MPRSNKPHIGVRCLLQILVRRKRIGFYSLCFMVPSAFALALLRPLQYEAEILIERKPATFSSQQRPEEFDISRLTSETQHTVALLKSRVMMERWLEAAGIAYQTPQQKERELKRLYRSLAVQPISYTDLFNIKVKAKNPAEAVRRVTLLAELFSKWDDMQNRTQADDLLKLLRVRLGQVKEELAGNWLRLKQYKRSQSLSLSGSNREEELEPDIEAKKKLFDLLSMEIDATERRLQNQSIRRTQLLAPATVSAKPVYSRIQLIVVAVNGAILIVLGIMFVVESQDPAIYRVGDITRLFFSRPVMVVPPLDRGPSWLEEAASYLHPVLDEARQHLQSKGTVMIQLISSEEGDGKTTMAHALAGILSKGTGLCIVHRTRKHNSASSLVQKNENGYSEMSVGATSSMESVFALLKPSHAIVILDIDAPALNVPGSVLVEGADISGIVLAAGRTSMEFLRRLQPSIDRRAPRDVFFILNRFEEALPPWLRR